MSDTTYNGWTNYATWRVNLEIYDGFTAKDYGYQNRETHELADYLKEDCEEYLRMQVEGDGEVSLVLDYALAFVADVNWHEIAEHMLEE